eukprot:6044410-Amphidinium_carterae.1
MLQGERCSTISDDIPGARLKCSTSVATPNRECQRMHITIQCRQSRLKLGYCHTAVHFELFHEKCLAFCARDLCVLLYMFDTFCRVCHVRAASCHSPTYWKGPVVVRPASGARHGT